MDIDIVVLWVDGSDPAWLAEKSKYLPPAERDSNSPNRYRDWGLLPYWFRAIEKFAPWARKIHFVTWGHVPAFLNLDAPKLHIVRHDEFIPAEYLPTFSSHTIELNLHRIPGLAEHFVYFNDDMFLLRPMQEEDFFRDGLPCTYGGEVPWQFDGHVGIWAHAAANDLGAVNYHFPKSQFGRINRKKYINKRYRWKDNLRTLALHILYPDYFTGFKNLHAPAPYLKRTFEVVWIAEPRLTDSTCRDKFRTASNANQWLFLWWQIASGNFSPYVVDNLVMCIEPKTLNSICDAIEAQSHAMICINDPEGFVDVELLAPYLRESFEKILPEKSIYEK
ncbi:MAG: Stealth CR1 domain-containing protein [Oscillospiraceae bacterium]|nr:Stealth CR1 domain-containing protein [Oscillospiraceae bacterium]